MFAITRIPDESQTVSAPKWMRANDLVIEVVKLRLNERGPRLKCAANEDSAAQRARWLAELADALTQARRMAEALASKGVPESAELSFRIRAAALEVEALQLRRRHRSDRDEFDPEWMENLPWMRSA